MENFTPISKIFRFRQEIYITSQRLYGYPNLPSRAEYDGILFQCNHVPSSYIFMIYVNFNHHTLLHFGTKRENDNELWREYFYTRGPRFFDSCYRQETIYRGYQMRICNNLTSKKIRETEFGKYLVSQYRLGKGLKIPTAAGMFRFRGEFYLYYRGYGVFHNREACGETTQLEKWEQTALYCYILMRMII